MGVSQRRAVSSFFFFFASHKCYSHTMWSDLTLLPANIMLQPYEKSVAARITPNMTAGVYAKQSAEMLSSRFERWGVDPSNPHLLKAGGSQVGQTVRHLLSPIISVYSTNGVENRCVCVEFVTVYNLHLEMISQSNQKLHNEHFTA